MAKMRIYTVHIDPSKKHPYESPIFIEENFNFFAFVFREFWAFYHKIWSVGIALLGLRILLAVSMEMGYTSMFAMGVLTLGIMAWVGFSANDMRREKLKRQGYITIDIVTSDNLVGAEQRFFERYFTQNRPVSYHKDTSGVLPATA